MAVQAPPITDTDLAADLALGERPLLTGEDLFKMGDIGRTELVKGEIVYMAPTGYAHGYTECAVGKVLSAFAERHHLGRVMVGEVGIYTARDPDTVRGADVVFISHERMAQVKSPSYLDMAPDLIVEILSPEDRWGDLMEKLEEYFAIGVRAVWVADPKTQAVYVYRSLTDVQRFTAADELPGGDVLPGFSVPVKELFA
jgi:Uma2 family endonuclease